MPIEMSRRARNLNLAKDMGLMRQNDLAELLQHIVQNKAYFSEMCLGKREIETSQARQIEEQMNLPTGWLDRDNLALLRMSKLEGEIHFSVSKLPREKQEALAVVLQD